MGAEGEHLLLSLIPLLQQHKEKAASWRGTPAQVFVLNLLLL